MGRRTPGGVIVAGVDGSPRSVPVLRWAYEQSRLTGARLVAVMGSADGPGSRGWSDDDAIASAWAGLRAAVVEALGAGLAHDVEVRVLAQAPGEALVAESRGADAVVVGVHSLHSVHPLRSVTGQLIRGARAPVVVVRKHRPVVRGRVVVGVSGSPSSRRALEWAVRQAELLDGTVDAVLAWEWEPEFAVFPYGGDRDTVRRRHEADLDAELARLPASDRSAVRGRAVEGHPVHVLLGAAAGADVVVLGVDGHHTLADRVLGSVSERMVRHAPVPVALIRSLDQSGPNPAGGPP